MSVYFCGGSCIEDVTTHLMYHLSLHPTLARPTTSTRQTSWIHCSSIAYCPQGSWKSLCQPNGSGHQGSMCWISIHATTLMLMCSRMTLDNTDNLWSWFCVLPQVAWWGKGILCVFVAIFAALRPLLPLCRYLFDLCVILWGRLRIWGINILIIVMILTILFWSYMNLLTSILSWTLHSPF